MFIIYAEIELVTAFKFIFLLSKDNSPLHTFENFELCDTLNFVNAFEISVLLQMLHSFFIRTVS